MSQHIARRGGFTLIEACLAIMVLGVIAALAFPYLDTSARTLAATHRTDTTLARATHALARAVETLRNAPVDVATGQIEIAGVSASFIEFADGTGLDLSGTSLLLLGPGESDVLADDVQGFVIRCLGSDGRTSTTASPALTQRFEIELSLDGLTLSASAFPRAKVIHP